MNDKLFAFLEAADEAFAGLSDGAWYAALEDAVREFNRQNKTRFDPSDAVAKYIDRIAV